MTWVLHQTHWIIPLKPALGCVRPLDSLELVHKIRPASYQHGSTHCVQGWTPLGETRRRAALLVLCSLYHTNAQRYILQMLETLTPNVTLTSIQTRSHVNLGHTSWTEERKSPSWVVNAVVTSPGGLSSGKA